MLRTLASALALTISLGTLAHADSFKTEPNGGSKRAAKIGPPAYVGQSFSTQQALTIVKKGSALMRQVKDVAVRMDAIRIVDSATMESTTARRAFAKDLAKIAKSGDARDQFVRGYNLLMRSSGRGALKMVGSAAAALPGDSAVQLGAFQAYADYANGGSKMKRGERVAAKYAAGKFYKQAKAIEAKHPRPLVENNLAETDAYLKYYPEMSKYLK